MCLCRQDPDPGVGSGSIGAVFYRGSGPGVPSVAVNETGMPRHVRLERGNPLPRWTAHGWSIWRFDGHR